MVWFGMEISDVTAVLIVDEKRGLGTILFHSFSFSFFLFLSFLSHEP